jgi:hypothetical protein
MKRQILTGASLLLTLIMLGCAPSTGGSGGFPADLVDGLTVPTTQPDTPDAPDTPDVPNMPAPGTPNIPVAPSARFDWSEPDFAGTAAEWAAWIAGKTAPKSAPVVARVTGIDLGDAAALTALLAAIPATGVYCAFDLRGCAGTALAAAGHDFLNGANVGTARVNRVAALILPDTVTALGAKVLRGYNNLRVLEARGLTHISGGIGSGANSDINPFNGCMALEALVLGAAPPALDSNAFYYTSGSGPDYVGGFAVVVPAGAKDGYAARPDWLPWAGRIVEE